MITNSEMAILQTISRKSLIKKGELLKILQALDQKAVEKSIEMLKDSGLIDIVAPMGETSFAITLKGMRFIAIELPKL